MVYGFKHSSQGHIGFDNADIYQNDEHGGLWYGLPFFHIVVFAFGGILLSNLTYSIGRGKIDFSGKLDEYVGAMQLLALVNCLVLCRRGASVSGTCVRYYGYGAPHGPSVDCVSHVRPPVLLYQSKYKYLYRYRENILITAFIAVGSVAVSIMALSCMRGKPVLRPDFRRECCPWRCCLWGSGSGLSKPFFVFNRTYFLYGLIHLPSAHIEQRFLNILAQSDRIMISRFKGPAMAGIYTLAYQFAILISLFLIP